MLAKHVPAFESSPVCLVFQSFYISSLYQPAPLFSLPPPLHHVSALSVYYSLPCGSVPFSCKSVLCCLLFFFFYLVYAFCTACHAVCDCHLSPCERAKCCCVFLPLSVSFIHSPSSSSSRLLRGECMWLRKQMYNDSTRRGPSNWASEARVSLASTCVGYSSPILFDSFFFPDLSITNSASCRSGVTGGPCERSSEIDRQVRELIVVQDTSAGAQRYSSYTSPASPPLYTILPPCEERSLIHSPPNCFFSVTHAPGKPGLLAGIHRLLPPPPPRYWSGLEKPRRFDISNTRLKRASQPAPARAFNFPIAYLVFHVWGKFGERSYASRDNMQLYDPPGFIQAHLGGDRVSALHYRVNYTSICLGLLYGYL